MQSCQIFFLKKLAQKLGLLLIEGRKVSQRCRLGCGQPKGPAIGLGDIYIPPCKANKYLGISTTVCNHLSFSSNFLYH